MLNSVFVRLLLVAAVFGCAVNFAVYRGVRHLGEPSPAARELMGKNVRRYFGQLAESIGDARNTEKARTVAAETGLEIMIEGPEGTFKSRDDLARVTDAEEAHNSSGRFRPRPFGTYDVLPRVRAGGSTFTFYLPAGVRFAPDPLEIAAVLLVVTTILALSYLAIRRMLTPLHALAQGADAVAGGNLGYRVKAESQDEFAKLAIAFNGMVERIQRLVAAKEQLLIDVSHELQSPLARMKMAVELLGDTRWKPHLARDVAEMETMVAEILESARLGSAAGGIDRRPTDLGELVAFYLQPLLSQAPGIDFQAQGVESLAELDGPRIGTVVRNLVDNALKYSGAAGRPVEVRVVDAGAEIELVVRDFGPGIPEAEIPKLFEPFYRVDKSRSKESGGYGLGLSLCQRIVQAHGGRIDVTSGRGREGTIVTVRLPKTAGKEPLENSDTKSARL